VPPKPVSFIKDVAPILKENCFACHDAKKRKGKLDMTTYQGLRKGGTKDDPIVPGSPADSLLIDLITARDGTRMPPRDAGDPLNPARAAVISRWIEQGARLDPGLDPRADLLRELRVRWQPPPPPIFYRYPVAVTALAFTRDNQHVVVSSCHELTVWDISHGSLNGRVATRAERAYAMAFLSDGKLAVAGGRPGEEGDVRIYDLSAGSGRTEHGVVMWDGVNDRAVMVKELIETDDAVLCLAADGKKLAAGGCDRLVRVWDLGAGSAAPGPAQTVENHADWVFGIQFAPGGNRLLTASRDKTSKVWNVAACESEVTFPDHQNGVYGVAVKPDGKLAASVGEDAQVRLWNTAGEAKQVRAMAGHGGAVFKVLWHPTQPLLVTCGADHTVRLWNPDNGAPLRVLSGHSDWVYALALSRDGRLLASGSWNGEVRIWRVTDGTLVRAFNASPGWPPAVKK
jgi:WD40 repeat protein